MFLILLIFQIIIFSFLKGLLISQCLFNSITEIGEEKVILKNDTFSSSCFSAALSQSWFSCTHVARLTWSARSLSFSPEFKCAFSPSLISLKMTLREMFPQICKFVEPFLCCHFLPPYDQFFLSLFPKWSTDFCFSLNKPNLARNGLPSWDRGKEPSNQCRWHQRHGFDPWVRKTPWRWKQQPTLVLLSGKSDGQRGLVGYSPQGCRESDTTEHCIVLWTLTSDVVLSEKGEPSSVITEQSIVSFAAFTVALKVSLLSLNDYHTFLSSRLLTEVSRALVFLFQTFVLARHSTFTFLMWLFLCCFFQSPTKLKQQQYSEYKPLMYKFIWRNINRYNSQFLANS